MNPELVKSAFAVGSSWFVTSGTGVVAAGVRWVGRVDLSNPQRPRFSWSGSGFVSRFSGTSLSLQINSSGAFIFKTVVDGTPKPAFTVAAGQQTASLVTGLAAGTHTVELYRQTEELLDRQEAEEPQPAE